jgi:hypothetical protein
MERQSGRLLIASAFELGFGQGRTMFILMKAVDIISSRADKKAIGKRDGWGLKCIPRKTKGPDDSTEAVRTRVFIRETRVFSN